MKKQTAVQWLFEKITEHGTNPYWDMTFVVAEEMEKQQIIQAHGKQLKKTQTASNYEYWKTGEQYYNETYGDK
jgi:hypothetical protein